MIENNETEFKREYVEDIKNTVIAFANGNGGTIYIGVEDNGTACGVSNIDEQMLKLINALRDSIRPDVMMFVDCKNVTLEEKQVICLKVKRGTARPYYLRGKWIRPEGVFVRQGASTVPASEAAIFDMIKDTCGDSFEDMRSFNQDLSFIVADKFFKDREIELGVSQKRTLNFVAKDGTFTNLALLLSDQCLHSIKVAIFEGSKKTIFKDRKEFSGSLFSQLENVFEYIDLSNRVRAEFSGLNRIDCRDYPVEAVREALLNALVHRDYSYSESTLIRIYDDRIEFVSIGGLVKGITLEDIELGVSMLRNPHLANIFYRLKLIEAYGTGLLKIKESYAEYAVKPKIEVSSHAFKITLPNVNFFKEQHDNHNDKNRDFIFAKNDEDKLNRVFDLCKKKGFIVRKDIEENLNVSQAAAVILLRGLVERQVLIKQGKARNTRYYLKNK